MPAKDIFHDKVRRALEKDGWTITDDPYSLKWDDNENLFVDLAAEKLIVANKGADKIIENNRIRRSKRGYCGMEKITGLREIIEQVLREHAEFYRAANAQHADENMVETVFDREGNHYVLFNIAWEGYDRTHYAVIHLEIVNGKIWIQKDETEEGIATDLEKYGVPKDKIALAFKSPALRKYTEYAAV